MPRKVNNSRNTELQRGVERYSRSDMYRRSGKLAKKKAKKRFHGKKADQSNVKPYGKKGETRTVENVSKFYPVYPIRSRQPSSKGNHKATRLRASITPGTILILLSGRFRGRRVVFLKQLPSGLLLINGPFSVNGVNVRRVNQRYVIATTTKIDISKLEIPAIFSDDYFKKQKRSTRKDPKAEKDFFAGEEEKKSIPQEKKDAQAAFDKGFDDLINAQPLLRKYLAARFSLSRNDRPHNMKF
eukprot:TRINITY_DN21641_c0_g2_i1.p1 TRINITY_DN21641_c0_g2~~TRINITY_DN21641_c0_g2_i1.p1  ORF type:complete len:242 (+),score=48.77 TRINITY_DN21641_c0_g2_i1:91-816(+)